MRRSEVRATQLVALEEMTTLSIDDPIVRTMLTSIPLASFVPNYQDPDLLLATAKAFGSINNSETHAQWSPIVLRGRLFTRENMAAIKRTFK